MFSEKIINKNDIVPIYHQLKTLIKEQIEDNVWSVDEVIPSERELSESFDISRLTVRQAINDLVSEGVLYRKRGIGTFVAKKKINQVLTKLSSFTSDMEMRGFKPGAKVLDKCVVPSSKKIATIFNIEEGEKVAKLFRLRLADDEPMALEKSFLPVEKVGPILGESLENKSLYKELIEKCNLNLVRAIQTIEISYADKDEAELLNIESGTPVLLIERTTFSDKDIPLEYVQSLYRADRYKFSIEMKA